MPPHILDFQNRANPEIELPVDVLISSIKRRLPGMRRAWASAHSPEIYEPCFLEAFLQARNFSEAPYVTARIWYLSHACQLSTLPAIERPGRTEEAKNRHAALPRRVTPHFEFLKSSKDTGSHLNRDLRFNACNRSSAADRAATQCHAALRRLWATRRQLRQAPPGPGPSGPQ